MWSTLLMNGELKVGDVRGKKPWILFGILGRKEMHPTIAVTKCISDQHFFAQLSNSFGFLSVSSFLIYK